MYFVGVMSGTSCDGADVVVVEFNENDSSTLNIIAAKTTAYPESIKQPLLKLIANHPLPISVVSQLDAHLGAFYADLINELLAEHAIEAGQDKCPVIAIGLHGQTVCHQPPNESGHYIANTLQLGSAAITAQQTGITAVANFRQTDVAFGGQGAPLAPVLHQQLFNQKDKTVAVLNLGGIANITLINGDDVLGFDTGPASCLMDEYIQSERNLAFDESGQWAQSGQVNQALLKQMLAEDYFNLPYPKSTGRELFNLEWLKKQLNGQPIKAADVQRTLLQFTVDSIALGLDQTQTMVDQMVVCGGGVHNELLMQQLQRKFNFKVLSSAELGLNPDFIEAILMAWLAYQNINQHSLDLAAITGCKTPHVYGIQYKAFQ